MNKPQLAARRLQVVLLGVAPGDRQSFPNPETQQAVQGYALLPTDRNGWFEISTDGERLWVEAGYYAPYPGGNKAHQCRTG